MAITKTSTLKTLDINIKETSMAATWTVVLDDPEDDQLPTTSNVERIFMRDVDGTAPTLSSYEKVIRDIGAILWPS